MHKSRKEIVAAIASHKKRHADKKEIDKKVKEIWKDINKNILNDEENKTKEKRLLLKRNIKKSIYIQLTTLNIHTVVTAKLKPLQWEKVTDIIKIERGMKQASTLNMNDYIETRKFISCLKNFAIQQARIPASETCKWKITW